VTTARSRERASRTTTRKRRNQRAFHHRCVQKLGTTQSHNLVHVHVPREQNLVSSRRFATPSLRPARFARAPNRPSSSVHTTHPSNIAQRIHPSRSSHARTTRRRRIRSDKCRVYGTSLFKAEAQSELGLRFNHHRDCRRRIARSPRNLAPTRSSASTSSYPSIARRRTSASAATATRTASFARIPTWRRLRRPCGPMCNHVKNQSASRRNVHMTGAACRVFIPHVASPLAPSHTRVCRTHTRT